jgi:hypothetical protein
LDSFVQFLSKGQLSLEEFMKELKSHIIKSLLGIHDFKKEIVRSVTPRAVAYYLDEKTVSQFDLYEFCKDFGETKTIYIGGRNNTSYCFYARDGGFTICQLLQGKKTETLDQKDLKSFLRFISGGRLKANG